MRIIKQMVLTVYEDGTTRCTERALARKDEATGRYLPNTPKQEMGGPVFPEFEPMFEKARK